MSQVGVGGAVQGDAARLKNHAEESDAQQEPSVLCPVRVWDWQSGASITVATVCADYPIGAAKLRQHGEIQGGGALTTS